MTLSPPCSFGDYQLLELLAQSSLAEVYRAKSYGVEGFEKVVVVKRLLPELCRDSSFIAMFINEAKVAVSLSHANIVQVFDLGQVENDYYIAMEHVAGVSLRSLLEGAELTRTKFPEQLSVLIASEAAKALDYAHRRRDMRLKTMNVVHREVTPNNLLISFEGEVKLSDFGFARARQFAETASGSVRVSRYAYMSPEQSSGEHVDARSDIFSLGVVLYEMLSGVNPLLGSGPQQTIARVRDAEIPPLRSVNSHVSEELAAIVERAVQREPDARYPDSGRFYEALVRHLYGGKNRATARDLGEFVERVRGQRQEGIAAEPSFGNIQAIEYTSSDRLPDEELDASTEEIPVIEAAAARRAVLLMLESGAGVTLPESPLRTLIHRFGGDEIANFRDGSQYRRLVAFNVAGAQGEAAANAARCALRVSRLMRASEEDVAVVRVRLALFEGELPAGGEPSDDSSVFERATEQGLSVLARTRFGAIGVSEVVAETLEERFRFRDGGELVGEKVLSEAYGRFVGRGEELARIGEVFALGNRGKRRVLALVGDAGVGKSRLLHETIRRLRNSKQRVSMYLVPVPSRSRQVPLSGIQALLRIVLGIDELDPNMIVEERVRRLRQLGLSDEDMQPIRSLLGLRDPHARAGTTKSLRATLTKIIRKLSEDELAVIALDGTDQLDDESQALVHSVIQETEASRLVLILAYRPGFVHPWSDLRRYYKLSLEGLNENDAAELVLSRLRAKTVPGSLLEDVVLKTGGNPYYIEEYLKALLHAEVVEVDEHGAAHFRPSKGFEVPKTLSGILEDRVARLPEREQRMLAAASVLGLRFAGRALASMLAMDEEQVARILTTLIGKGLVDRISADELSFENELLLQVVYRVMPIAERERLHIAAAKALEALYPNRIDVLAREIAGHYQEGGETAKAGGFMMRAAVRAEEDGAYEGALETYREALDWLLRSPNAPQQTVLECAVRFAELCIRTRSRKRGTRSIDSAIELAEREGRTDFVIHLTMLKGRMYIETGRFAEGHQWFERAHEAARRIGKNELLRDVRVETALAEVHNGQFAAASALVEEALRMAKETADGPAQARCLAARVVVAAASGSLEEREKLLDEARRIAGMQSKAEVEAEILWADVFSSYLTGRFRAAIRAAERARDFVRTHNFHTQSANLSHLMGAAYLRLGEERSSFAALRDAYEQGRDYGMRRVEMICARDLAFIDATQLGARDGVERMERAHQYAITRGHAFDALEGEYLIALAKLLGDDTEGAKRGFRDVVRLAAEQGNALYLERGEAALKAIARGDKLAPPY